MKRVLLIIISLIFFSLVLIYFYSKKLSPILIKYASIEGKNKAIDIISKNISKSICNSYNDNDLFIVEKDKNGNIETVDYNSKTINNLLSISTKQAIKNFNSLKDKKYISYIPLGASTKNIFFNNLGPKIPIKLELDGNVMSSLNTNVKEYGMNSALVEVSIRLESNISIIIPFNKKDIKIVNNIPISIKLIKGNISGILNED